MLALYRQCGIDLDEATFLNIWALANLGIAPEAITDLLRDVAKYAKKS